MPSPIVKEEKHRSRIRDIARFHQKNGRMPSFSELCKITGLRSKNSVFKLVARLEKLKVLERDRTGRLIAGSIACPLKVLGTVEAGFPSPAEEELVDTLSLDDFLIQNREATFLLKVSGDSMSDAGILPGDMVIVDKGRTPKSGDIVIAQVDGEWTMKLARVVVGVDTGLTHLAVALGRPTIGLYCATDPAATGLFGSPGALNLGDIGETPSTDEVADALQRLLETN